MDRFVSIVTNRLDAKGRVSIPAPFRAVLARDGLEGLSVHPCLDQPALDCGGHALLAEIDAMIASFPPHSADRDALLLTLLGESDRLRIDGEGRIVLTEALKAHAQITVEVSFVGTGHKFQIWDPSRFQLRLVEARRQALLLRERHGSRPPDPETAGPPHQGAGA